MPWYTRFDWIEIYDYIPNKEDRFGGPFKRKWRDDFDEFDSNRWQKTNNWGFQNEVTFMSS